MKKLLTILLTLFLLIPLISAIVFNLDVSASSNYDHTDVLTDKIEFFTHDEVMLFLAFVYNVREVNNLSDADELIYKYMRGQLTQGSEDYFKAQIVFHYATLGIIEDNCNLTSSKTKLSSENLISFLEDKIDGKDAASDIANDFLGEVKSSIKKILSVAVGKELSTLMSGYNSFVSILNVKDKVDKYYDELCAALNTLNLVINRDMTKCYNYFLQYYNSRDIVNLNDSNTIGYFELLLDTYTLGNISELDAISVILGNLGLRTWSNDELRIMIRRFAEFSYHTTKELNSNVGSSGGSDSGGTIEREVISISVTNYPSQTMYAIGETFNSSGLKLLVQFNDGSDTIVNSGFSCSYNFTSAGYKTVKISYGGQTTSIEVLVVYAYGSCGENATYVLKTGGHLEIEGSGTITRTESTTKWLSCNISDIYSIYIDDDITNIPEYTFAHCSNVKTISMPAQLVNIGNYAFYNCSSLTSITIPKKVVNIGQYAFKNCTSMNSVTIKDGVYSIDSYAFSNCTSLTSVFIPNSIAIIGDSAFRYCSNIASVTIGNGVITIKDNAFGECISLTNMVIPNSVINIDNWVFYDCSGLQNITIGNSVQSIGASVFYGCNNLESINIPNSVTSIDVNCFAECSNLKNLYITSIESWLNVKLSDSYSNPLSFSGGNLYIDDVLSSEIAIPDNITYIGDYAFKGCNSLTSITLPDTIISIGDLSFSNCNNLKNLKMGKSIESIGIKAFYSCKNLESINIPNSVKNIDSYAFDECRKLKSISIPASVINIGISTFGHCFQLTEIKVNKNNTKYCDIDGILFSKDKKTLIQCPGGITKEYIVPDGVTKIDKRAFYSCPKLTSIIISDSVTSIDSGAFLWSTRLKSIVIPGSVTDIASNAFYGCRLTSIYIYKNSYAEEYCLANEDLKTKIVYIPTNEFLTFSGFQMRKDDYNGLRYRFTADFSKIDELENDGFTVVEFGTLMAASSKLASLDELTVSKNESGEYDTLSFAKRVPIYRDGAIVNKYISKADDKLSFACTIVKYNVSNFDLEVTARGYAIVKDAAGNEYVVYADYPNENYRSLSLERVCDELSSAGLIDTSTNISYIDVAAFKKERDALETN